MHEDNNVCVDTVEWFSTRNSSEPYAIHSDQEIESVAKGNTRNALTSIPKQLYDLAFESNVRYMNPLLSAIRAVNECQALQTYQRKMTSRMETI